MNETL